MAPENSIVGLVLLCPSLIIMPVLAYAKQRTGREMSSEALQADAVEAWVCSYLSLTLLAGDNSSNAAWCSNLQRDELQQGY